jgi:hypothetical protein
VIKQEAVLNAAGRLKHDMPVAVGRPSPDNSVVQPDPVLSPPAHFACACSFQGARCRSGSLGETLTNRIRAAIQLTRSRFIKSTLLLLDAAFTIACNIYPVGLQVPKAVGDSH